MGTSVTITVLTNNNFVVAGYGTGTVTWVSGTVGLSGTVSATNSLIEGGVPTDTAVTTTNGNYVVTFRGWNGGLGAVTWGNGFTGTSGVVSATNSLVGTLSGDDVGGFQGDGGVVALANGNYVVDSWDWTCCRRCAVTWGNGTAGVTGTISATNSLVGNSNDRVGRVQGQSSSIGIVTLPNGNYVVESSYWNSAAGGGWHGATVRWESPARCHRQTAWSGMHPVTSSAGSPLCPTATTSSIAHPGPIAPMVILEL